MHDLTPGARVDGRVLLDGANIYAPEVDPVTIRHRIGMVFQRPNPFPKSIFENVAYGPIVHGERRAERPGARFASAACAARRFGTKSKIG